MLNPRSFALLIAGTLAATGCHAQTPPPAVAPGTPLPPSIARRVEVLLRTKAALPPGSTVQVSPATPSEFPGYKTISVSVLNDGKSSHPINFLISDDGKSLGQFNKYDISADPRTAIAFDGRPSRGGPATAPVIIVGFDDLECPFCARLHSSIFPAITERYGDKVHIVYKDFPLTDIHPWAMHAAVDVNCVAEQSVTGYWKLVDTIHAHSPDIGANLAATAQAPGQSDKPADKSDKTLPRAIEQLDTLTKAEGQAEKVDMPKLEACIAKQDTKAVEAEKQIAVNLNLESAPTLFINGDKIEGSVPIEFIFGVIDDALRAENIAPPPPFVAPKPSTEAKPEARPAAGTSK